MCESIQFPAYKWYSNSDVTNPEIGWTCTKLEGPAPDSTLRGWFGLGKLLRLLESWPWE